MYRDEYVRPATAVGSAKGMSISEFKRFFPGNW
jgi:hypothetical protein